MDPHETARANLGDTSSQFVVGIDQFDDLSVNPTPNGSFFYFFSRRTGLIKEFILRRGRKVDHICVVTLIAKGDKFCPRLTLSIRDKAKKIALVVNDPLDVTLKASVNLEDCHEPFWQLIDFLESLREIELPRSRFSLVPKSDAEVVQGLNGRARESVVEIIRGLSAGISFSKRDIDQLLRRRERLTEGLRGLDSRAADEPWWQSFFESNKWIFGYGLNYRILKQEQSQPHYGGTNVRGKGGQRGDFLAATQGDISFTVLVEIKAPATPLIQGKQPIRSGTWSLSRDLIDALAQLQTNVDTWNRQGASQSDNRDDLETRRIFTVVPRGILVIGRLGSLSDRHQRETFQRFRTSQTGVEILTFDEVLERARFMVESDG